MKKYQDLTKFIALLEKEQSYGEWIGNEAMLKARPVDDEGNPLPFVAPYVRYSPVVSQFISEVLHYQVPSSGDAAKESAMEYTEYNLLHLDVTAAPANLLVAFVRKIVRNERYRDGVVLEYLENGRILTWLKKLKEIDV